MEEKEITLQDILTILKRRKWTIITISIFVITSALYYSFSQSPEYRSEATFIIESSDVVFPGATSFKMKESVRPFEFYQAVVNSRAFVDRTIRALIDSCRKDPDIQLTLNEAIGLIGNLKITNSDYEDFIQLSAVANHPKISYLLAEIGTNMLKIRCQEIDQEEYQNVVLFVDKQKNRALHELEIIEQNLQAFLKNTDSAILNDEEGGVLKKLIELEDQLTAIQTEKEVAEANLATYEQRMGQLESQLTDQIGQNEYIHEPEIDKLRSDLSRLDEQKNAVVQNNGSGHAEIDALDKKIENKKKELIQKLLESSRANSSNGNSEQPNFKNLQELKIREELKLYELKNREQYYNSLLENYKKKHPNMLEHAIEVAQLNRAKTVQQNLYSFLLEKGEEARIKAATGTGGIRIIDHPTVPVNSIPAKTKKILLLAIFLGTGLGFGVAYLQEFWDNSIKSTDDVTRYLELPVMGVIPVFRHKNGFSKMKIGGNGNNKIVHIPGNGNGKHLSNGTALISRLKSKDPLVEAYRGLRTNLQFSSMDEPLKSLMITSSLPGEGKTVTSANLAISFAQMGLNTILVDADLRKPQQHRLFQVERSPGLLECLMEDVALGEVFRESGVPGLKIIPSGLIPPNPAEVLNSKRMRNLVEELQGLCDIVIFDTPPVIAVTDPIILGKQVNGLLLVIKYQNTDRSAAQKAMAVLKNAKLNVLGAVINYADFGRGPDYYHYYHNYYGESESYNGNRTKIVLN